MSAPNLDPPKQIPVTLLSGFLGSGKTTLLKHILTSNHGLKIAVIINDIASVNIDAKLVQNKDFSINQLKEKIVQLENGCACCTLRSDLVSQLVSLAYAKKFDYILIETSGLSEPMSIAQTFTEDFSRKLVATYTSQMQQIQAGEISPQEVFSDMDTKEAYWLIQHVIRLGGINRIAKLDTAVTVVDAFNFLSNYESFELATTLDAVDAQQPNSSITDLLIQQIEFADIILVNKISEVKDESVVKKIESIIEALNPEATVIKTDYSAVKDLKLLLNSGSFSFERISKMSSWINSIDELGTEVLQKDKEQHENGNKQKEEHKNGEQKHKEVKSLEEHKDHEHKDHDHEHEHEHDHKGHDHGEHSHCGHNHAPGESCENHITKYGINSFIYRSNRPFHPGRLNRLLRDKYLLMKQGDEEEEEPETHETSPGKRVKSSEGQSKKPKLEVELLDPDFPKPTHQELMVNKKNSVFANVIRLKGFIWIASNLMSKCELGGSGQIIKFQPSGQWLNQFTLPVLVPYVENYKKMKAKKLAGAETQNFEDLFEEDIDTSNVEFTKEDFAQVCKMIGLGEAEVKQIVEKPFGDSSNEIVFIGFNINEKAVSDELNKCLLNDEEWKLFQYLCIDQTGLFTGPGGDNELALKKLGKPEGYEKTLEKADFQGSVDIIMVEDFFYSLYGDNYVLFI